MMVCPNPSPIKLSFPQSNCPVNSSTSPVCPPNFPSEFPPNITHYPFVPTTPVLSKLVDIFSALNGSFILVGDDKFSLYFSNGFWFCYVHPKKYNSWLVSTKEWLNPHFMSTICSPFFKGKYILDGFMISFYSL